MAIKNDDDDDYEIDLEGLDDFDTDEFDVNGISSGNKKDRNPVTSAINTGSKAVFDSTIGSAGVRDELITKALPGQFRSAYRKSESIKGEIDKTIDHLEKEMRESKRDAKAAARAVLPMIKPFLPASITRKISDVSKEDAHWSGGEVDRDSAEIAAAIESVFGGTSNPQEARREQQEEQLHEATKMIAEEEKSLKQDSMLEHIINIDDGVKTVVRSHASAIDYRRKMLELNYRQYFAQRDMLKANVEAYEKIIPALEAITKNTALPDYAKEEFGEITGALMKRNIIEKLSPLNWSRNYHKYVGIAARNKITELASNARNAFSMMQMGGSMAGGEMDDSDITADELKQNYMNQGAVLAGSAGGGIINEKVLMPLAGKFNKWLMKNPNAMRALAAGSMAIDNQAAFINSVRGDPTANVMLRKLVQGIDWLGVRGPDDMSHVDFETETVASLAKASAVTRKTVRTIEHVIPGALFKIDQSIRRIYDRGAALEMFDFERDKFVTVESWKKHVYATAATDINSRSLDSATMSLFYDLQRDNEGAKEAISKINDKSRDIIKKAFELAAREHCSIFDPRQLYEERIPLGIDATLWYSLDSEEERGALYTALSGVIEAAVTGLSGDAKEARRHAIKLSINQRAQQHYGAQSATAANRVRDLKEIYGVGMVTQTDLVVGKKYDYGRSRPDYYLGKVKVINGEWVEKGVYFTSNGVLFDLRDVTSTILGPRADDKIEGRKVALVTPEQLQHLKTRTGEHYLTVENTLGVGDKMQYRVNQALKGTSFLKDEFGGTLGSQLDTDEADVNHDGSGVPRNRTKSRDKVSARRLKQEAAAIAGSASIKVDKLTVNVEGVESRLDSILQQLASNNYKEDLREIILAIETHSGIVSHSINIDPKIRERIEAARNKARSLGSKLAEKGRNTRDWVKNRYTKTNEWLSKYDLTMNPFKMVGRLTASTYHAVTEFGKGILGRRDILDAVGNVVISALDIQSKRLYTLDENNEYKLITKISDIKGGVYRLSEDGLTYNQVYSPDAIAAKFDELCYSTKTGIRKVASDVGGFLGDRLRSLHAKGKSIVDKTKNFGTGILKSTWGAVAFIPDIYYSLDPEPREARLLARVAKEDGYIDVKTGKPVRYFSDIHGEIRDLDGNVRISQSDFENPKGKFIDANGEDVTSLFTSILGTLGRIRKRTWNAAKGIYDSFRNAANSTMEFLGGLKNKFLNGGFVTNQRMVVQRLEQIYILLNDRIAGSGQGGPLPFTPMEVESASGTSGKAAQAVKQAVSGVSAKVSDIMDTPLSDYLSSYSGKAKEQYAKAKSVVSSRLANYTDNFCKEFARATGKDPNVEFGRLLSKLGQTRDTLLAESGIDQTLLDIALLEPEFENLYRRYERGEISKADYQAAIKELAMSSQYAKIYEQSMGYLGKKLKGLRQKAAKRAADKATTASNAITNSTYWHRAKESKNALRDAFRKVTGKLTPKSIKAQIEAITNEINNLDPADPHWEDKIIALHEKKAELMQRVSSVASTGGDYLGRGLNFFKTKFTGRGGDVKVNGDNTVDTDGDGVRDNSYMAKFKEKANAGFFKNMTEAFGGMFGKAKNLGKGDGKPGLLSAIGRMFTPIMTVLTPLIGGLLTTVFTGTGGILSVLKTLVTSLVSGTGSLAWAGAKMAGRAAMAVATPALSLAGGALGAAGGAVMGLALNPMTWAVVGGALALYAGYKTYRWATAERLPKIDQLRVASYGAKDYSRLDLTDTQKTLFLEDAISQYVSYDQSGIAKIGNISGKDMVRIIQGWGIDPADNASVQLFMNWFQRRFLPVHYIWLTAAKQNLKIDSLKDIGNEKSFTAEDRMKVVNATRLKSDSIVWRMGMGPYNDNELLGFKDVDELYEETTKDWKAEAESSAKGRSDKDNYLGGSRRMDVKQWQKERKADEPEFEQKDRRSLFSFNDKAGNSEELDGRDVFTSKVYGTEGYMPKDNGFRQVTNTVDAVTAVRLRLYGCWDLTTQNINNAFALEDMVYPDLATEDNKLVYKGDFADLFQRFKGLGGLPGGYGIESFRRWFNMWFMPVLSAYIGAVNKELKATDPFNIPQNGGSKGFVIARAMYAVKGSLTVTSLPFINKEIDTQSLAYDTIESSMASLEKLHRAYKVKELGQEKKQTTELPKATDEQNRVLNATGGKYTIKDGKIVPTEKGRVANTIAPWKAGEVANGGGRPPASVWGKETTDTDAHAGHVGPIKPPPPSPKREEAERLLIEAAVKAGITDPTEIAMLLAHAAHESGNFKSVEENLKYSSNRLLEIFPRYFSPSDAQKYGGDPVAIANIAYGNRMGNRDPGDGYKYRGRGFMQLTGRNNYEALAKAYPQARDPDWVSTPEGAAASAVYWWTSIAKNSIRGLAQRGDVLGTTQIVNGGTNGISDRRDKFSYYMSQIKSGKMPIAAAKNDKKKTDNTDESGLAGAQRDPEAVSSATDLMSQGAGEDSVPVKQPLTETAKATAEVPNREAGRPEEVQAKAVAKAMQSTAPTHAAPSTAPRANVPTPAVVQKESAAMKGVAEKHALDKPMNRLVELTVEANNTLELILAELRGGRSRGGNAKPAPISMTS